MRGGPGLVGMAIILAAATACGAPAATSPATSATTTSAPSAAQPAIYDPNADAKSAIAAAVAQARTDHKNVLIDFGANWCPDCHALDRMYHEQPAADTLSKDYHLVVVDVGETKAQYGVLNHDLTQQYDNLTDQGIPALAVLAPDGSVVTTTKDGSFEDARHMNVGQVNSFLVQYAPKAGQ
jgi:thiol:disulfide interchange protein